MNGRGGDFGEICFCCRGVQAFFYFYFSTLNFDFSPGSHISNLIVRMDKEKLDAAKSTAKSITDAVSDKAETFTNFVKDMNDSMNDIVDDYVQGKDIEKRKTESDKGSEGFFDALSRKQFHKAADNAKKFWHANKKLIELFCEKDSAAKVKRGHSPFFSHCLFPVDNADVESFLEGIEGSFVIHEQKPEEDAIRTLESRMAEKVLVCQGMKDYSEGFPRRISDVLGVSKSAASYTALSCLMNELFTILRPVGVTMQWEDDDSDVFYGISAKLQRKSVIKFYVNSLCSVISDILNHDIRYLNELNTYMGAMKDYLSGKKKGRGVQVPSL